MLLLLTLGVAQAVTAIGHPDIHHGTAANLAFTTFSVEITTLDLDLCGGGTDELVIDDVLEAGDTLVLPSGCFSAITVNTTALTATGTGAGGTFALELEPGAIEVALPDVVVVSWMGHSSLVLGEADWVTASMLDLAPSVHRTVGGNDELFSTLNAVLRETSFLVI